MRVSGRRSNSSSSKHLRISAGAAIPRQDSRSSRSRKGDRVRATVERPSGLDAKVDDLTVNAYSIPTDAPEADGTFEWRQTTIVVVEIDGGGRRGLGYTYTDAAAAT